MSETELRVVCKSCGAEVSPYVTECPYCGARVRKRAPKLERRDGGLEAKRSRRDKRRERQANKRRTRGFGHRPVAAFALILIPAVALLARIATGGAVADFGGLVAPVEAEWWRFLTAPFAYLGVGYLFAVSVAVMIFVPGLERRLGTVATLVLALACGSLGALAGYGIEEQRGSFELIAGGNGIALGVIAAWYMVRRKEEQGSGEDPIDLIGVLVCATVVLLLPVVVETANVWAGLAGGAVGAVAGLAATLVRR